MGFSWPIRVYYEDTDAGGVVYHSNYLNFFERARTEWLADMGVEQTALLQQDIAFVVRSAKLDFLIPARFEQKLVVESVVSKLGKASVTFTQELKDSQGTVYCRGEIKVGCVRLSALKPCAIPTNIYSEFLRAS
ncbi:tol-pal system-associated acyl-CoA thioesterase [Paraferrimonas sedimenticola]|uniref:Tol-pal system-associated acyl-CoA thioesterase n=1 Tax=Paraferrimonas sedimenticola TaxID=375674 RepID=A0AA37RYZ0_9GAMM|nr:tol-pal system-associated acyl-CoA thioesterase [Paraferrimonas sedimenticola]GLP97970.1 tol-pal system-associated acyl-CoA thioesterase [Paraferrimonas sedimenticola]